MAGAEVSPDLKVGDPGLRRSEPLVTGGFVAFDGELAQLDLVCFCEADFILQVVISLTVDGISGK